ncbi:response regulator [Rhodocaloribacter litoris]|uniref:response regulator n=1 Tax=Rhodocaloribacter litoris TaxID=2558931 RepID=UPI001423FEED|nr:response regulator [Rhodocaloribacter litoris]QXD16236.1 response regulator [Rhodocaloribacter litoris]GIV60730.1 MAG: hypothetical protein KatS3mg043_1819 [Rhodothermaceae bacterium]
MPSYKPSILLVEDSEHTRLLVEYWLKDAFELQVATNPKAALAVADRPYDVLLIDINLGSPNNGIDLLATLRKRPDFAHTPAIAFTAYVMPEDRERLLKEGFDYYLGKPFSQRELLEVLGTALARPCTTC